MGNPPKSDKETKQCLFDGLVFFLSREVPRGYLELVILSFGGRVGWDGDDTPFQVNDKCITHHVIDRPLIQQELPSNKEYIQPQWIVDSANFTFLLPPSRYAPNKTLPPHLSPWMNPKEEGYQPLYLQEIENLKKGIHPIPQQEEEDTNHQKVPTEKNKTNQEETNDESSDSSEEEDDDDEDSQDNQKETNMKNQQPKNNQEQKELALLMMNRKSKSLYGRMQYGIAKKQAAIDNLVRKRNELESVKKAKNTKDSEKTKSGASSKETKKNRKKV